MPGDEIHLIVNLAIVVAEQRYTKREGYLQCPSSGSYRPLQPTATKSRPVCRFLAGTLHVVWILKSSRLPNALDSASAESSCIFSLIATRVPANCGPVVIDVGLLSHATERRHHGYRTWLCNYLSDQCGYSRKHQRQPCHFLLRVTT